MNGKERIDSVFSRERSDLPPIAPILHSALAGYCGVPLGDYFTRGEKMAEVVVDGFRRFGYDGAQLSSGVTAEPAALGARVEYPANGLPKLREYLLSDMDRLEELKRIDFVRADIMKEFFKSVSLTTKAIGGEAWILATLRGPLLTAAQLRGPEQTLLDFLVDPEGIENILDFTSELTARLGQWLVDAGADAVILGEATCSTDFLSPDLYRERVAPRHRELIAALKGTGWKQVGLHICGDIEPIIMDIVETGVDFIDVDHVVNAKSIGRVIEDRVVLRGNLDPSSVFRFGAVDHVRRESISLLKDTKGQRWIYGSGCDIPPGTQENNIRSFVEALHR